MIRYPDFHAAKRRQTPNHIAAAYYQHQGEMDTKRYNDEKKAAQMALPVDLYESYANVTGTNPIADALSRNKQKTAAPTPSAAPAGSSIPQRQPNRFAMPASSKPGAGMVPGGGGGSLTSQPQVPTMAAKTAGPALGGAMSAAQAASQGASTGDVIKQGVGGAAGGALMTFAPALAAAGPIGWAGMAGLAAASLYGMFG